MSVQSGNERNFRDNSGMAESDVGADDVLGRVVESKEVSIGSKGTVNSSDNIIANGDGLEKKMDLDIKTLEVIAPKLV